VTAEVYRPLNRYTDILPYEKNMATLDGKEFSGENYFNGNYILGWDNQVDFIATQGPLKQTYNDFWKVLLVNNIFTIVGSPH
jgi:receptor-type tyrosine-protein phosphatase O